MLCTACRGGGRQEQQGYPADQYHTGDSDHLEHHPADYINVRGSSNPVANTNFAGQDGSVFGYQVQPGIAVPGDFELLGGAMLVPADFIE